MKFLLELYHFWDWKTPVSFPTQSYDFIAKERMVQSGSHLHLGWSASSSRSESCASNTAWKRHISIGS